MVSNVEATADRSHLHSVQMILARDESRTKGKVVHNQNIRIRKVIDAYQQKLRDLEIALWELHDSTANSIAQLKNLKKLSIRLDHPHTRFPGSNRQFWFHCLEQSSLQTRNGHTEPPSKPQSGARRNHGLSARQGAGKQPHADRATPAEMPHPDRQDLKKFGRKQCWPAYGDVEFH